MESNNTILVWGAGAIGGTLAAYWARGGQNVLLVDINAAHVEACRTQGLHIEGPVETFRQVVPAAVPAALVGTYSRIVLAVKAHHTEAAMGQLMGHLAADGFVLSAQNGLNEMTIAKWAGAARTMGCFVNFGADWLEPGRILYGNRGACVVGEAEGQPLPRTREMHQLMALFEPDAVLTDDIWGYLWGKLAYGAMLFATALTMESMSENFADPLRTPAWLALGGEVMAVASARGVTPRGFGEFDPLVFAREGGMGSGDPSRALAAIAWLADYTSRTAKTHSGVWRDLAVRKRRTEVDAQIGVIGLLGREAGIATPALDMLVALIHDVEEGRRAQSAETFNALLARCS
jgi:2-dehydropantoate 2-reductase